MNVWKTWKGGTVLKCPALMLNEHDLRHLMKPRNTYQLATVSGSIISYQDISGCLYKRQKYNNLIAQFAVPNE